MRYIACLRVSTDQQGRSGLGLEAQREAVAGYLRTRPGAVLVDEHVEVESGKRRNRPELAKALAACRGHRAALVVAKLDRLARDAGFLLTVLDGAPAECGVVFCDLPTVPSGPVGRFLVSQMAAVAELEAGLIGQRTKAALAAAKARGVVLGGWRGGPAPTDADRAKAVLEHTRRADSRAADLAPVLEQLRSDGAGSLGALATGFSRSAANLPAPLCSAARPRYIRPAAARRARLGSVSAGPTAAGTLDHAEDAGLPVSRPAARQWGKHEPHRRLRAPRQAPTEEEAGGAAPRCRRSSPGPASAALGAPTNRRPLPLLWPTTTAGRPSDTAEGRDLSGQPQRWAMYVRWPSGRRETIFTEFPDQVAQLRCWVLARLPLPKITVAPGWV